MAALESVTDEGYVFRVDLRLRPEGRSGALILSLDGYRRYFADRAELWERQALIKARALRGRRGGGARGSSSWPGPSCSGPGSTRRIVARGPPHEAARSTARCGPRAPSARNVKLGRGGIREVEFLVQALQLLYAGDDPWLRERNTLRAIFRLTEELDGGQEVQRFKGHNLGAFAVAGLAELGQGLSAGGR